MRADARGITVYGHAAFDELERVGVGIGELRELGRARAGDGDDGGVELLEEGRGDGETEASG